MMMVKCEKGKLHNPMIGSQSCGGPGLLGCDLHKSFLDLFSTLS